MDEYSEAVATCKPDAILLNFHPATLTWADNSQIKSYGGTCFAICHEVHQELADHLDDDIFHFWLCPDPTLLPHNPVAIVVPRFSPKTRPAVQPAPEVFTVGSFGFAAPTKGFQKLCELVNLQFDRARIRINIPPHDLQTLIPQATADKLIDECERKITKPGISLEITQDFMSEDSLMDFLSENTINAFLYDAFSPRGISSCTDYALASGRPIAISNSTMFRNLLGVNPSISVTHRPLREIVESGIAPLRHHVAQYEPRASGQAWDSAILEALARREMCRSVPDGRGFNKILDDRSRLTYTRSLEELQQRAPDLLTRKIAQANIQQAFALDAVERFVTGYYEPRILAVGSFEDTTVAVLRAKGYRIDEVDPNVNGMDLDAFFSTQAVPGSYDIVLSVSVLEHVADDGRFVRIIADLLAPGGVAILTVDFSNDFPATGRKPTVDHRLYTTSDIIDRLMPLLPDCGLIDLPAWNDGKDDFTYEGCVYSFAAWVFRKLEWDRIRYAAPYLAAHGAGVKADNVLRQLLSSQGEIYDTVYTVIGDERYEEGMRVFTADGSTLGYLSFGPYNTFAPGKYRCSFVVRVVSCNIPDDTPIAVIDTAADKAMQQNPRTCTYGDFRPDTYSLISAEFDVSDDTAKIETRLLLLRQTPVTMLAAVAIERLDQTAP
ncbi:MAG: methyltransferase domain-containing protein [Alphaproteobacteria bacterium]|nr:methyltransferase domain-containing protein [Alphaproteobacteria bacterium]